MNRELTIPAVDGFELAASIYEATGPGALPAAVIIGPATGVKRTYYGKYAQFLADAGLTTVTFDYRGIGGSRPRSLRGFRCTMTEWGEKDLAGVIDWVSRELKPERLLAIGHSVGGQLLGLAHNQDQVTAMLAVAAQSGHWRHWPVPRRYLMMFVWYALIPGLTPLFSYFPSAHLGFGEDLPAGVALEWAGWSRHPEYLMSKGDAVRERYSRFQGEILSYAIEDDAYAPPAAVEWMTRCYTGAQWQLCRISPKEAGVAKIGHFGFFRDKFRATLWPKTLAWLKARAESTDVRRAAGIVATSS